MDGRLREAAGNVVDSNIMCSSEPNVSVVGKVSSTSITNNVVWQRMGGCYSHGCRPDKRNTQATVP